MQERVFKTLEFDKIKDQLIEHASSSLGRNKVEELVPSTDYNEVVSWQEETDEAAKVYRMRGSIPLDGIYDIRAHVKRSSIGGMLSPAELNQIASTVHASRQMKRFIEEFHEEEPIPILFTLTDSIMVLVEVEEEIKMAIDEQGAVMDSASDALRTLRNQLHRNESKVREKLESMIRSSSAQKMLSDSIITIRNDRYVIPVKQEYRGNYGGLFMIKVPLGKPSLLNHSL